MTIGSEAECHKFNRLKGDVDLVGMPHVVDIDIRSLDEREFPSGKESRVRFVLRFENGSSSEFRGHGVSFRNERGGFKVTHVLIAEDGPEFSYWSYEAEPV